MELEKRFYYIELFEIYQPLLTKKQCEYFCLSYLEDKSFAEISALKKISRAAVHHTVQITINEILKYEKFLKLHFKSKQRLSLYDKIEDINIKNQLLNLEKKWD